MSSLKEVIDNIKNAADDLATLQVTTFTGTLTTTVAPDGQIKWDELRKGSAATSGDLTLRGNLLFEGDVSTLAQGPGPCGHGVKTGRRCAAAPGP
jgi:hypothetical protein